MHLSIEIPKPPLPPPPPPPRAKVGECGGFSWHLKAFFVRGGGGISQDLLYTFIEVEEVGNGLVPSFLTVISSRGHWCRLLDLCSFVSTSGFEK